MMSGMLVSCIQSSVVCKLQVVGKSFTQVVVQTAVLTEGKSKISHKQEQGKKENMFVDSVLVMVFGLKCYFVLVII